MGGMSDLNDLVHLQVMGKSQIVKELEETHHLEQKFIDMQALHRNEMTEEVEPADGYEDNRI